MAIPTFELAPEFIEYLRSTNHIITVAIQAVQIPLAALGTTFQKAFQQYPAKLKPTTRRYKRRMARQQGLRWDNIK